MAYSEDKEPLELSTLTSLASDDTILVGDTSDTSELVKSITKANLITDLNSSLTIPGGDVTKVGTPANFQVGVWTGDGTLAGYPDFTYVDGTEFSVANVADVSLGDTATGYLGVTGGEVVLVAPVTKVGSGLANATVKSSGDFDLILQTGNATTGNITIADGANGDITLAPNGIGSVVSSKGVEINHTGGTPLAITDSTRTVNVFTGNDYVELTGSSSTASGFDIYAADNATYLQLTDKGGGAAGPSLYFQHSSATPAAADVVGLIRFDGKDSAANSQVYGAISGVITDPTSTSEDGKLVFNVTTAGANADELELTGAALYPATNDGLALGNITNQFSDLFLAEGAVINFDNGDATLTQIGNALTLAGADLEVPDEAYGVGWDGSLEVPTKNALYDKIETLGGGSGITRTVTTSSGNFTAGSSASVDYVYLIAGAHTVTLPAASGLTNRYTFKNNHSAAITIDRAGADTIDGATSLSLPVGASIDLISNASTAWNVI